MEDFLKSWGPAVITAVAIIILTLIVKAVAPSIKSGMEGIVTQFTEKTQISDDDFSNIFPNQ